MPQNRNKLIDLFMANISNSIVHRVLERAIDNENIRDHYNKESAVSFDIARRYREKINPISTPLPEKDIGFIKERIIRKARSELQLRISKGYKNIDLGLVESVVDEVLRGLGVI